VLLYELTRGLAYLRIKHPMIHWYTIRLPVVLSAVLCVAFAALPVKPKLLGGDGLMGDMLGIIATLPGFYFAALAAVATFDRPGMDVDIPDPAPTLKIRIHGKDDNVPLTKRMFLSYLFSYLTSVSLGLCGLILVVNALEPSIGGWAASMRAWPMADAWHDLAKIGCFALVVVPTAALAVSTMHGIFFLTERLHQPH
jgi:hypothetical protein